MLVRIIACVLLARFFPLETLLSLQEIRVICFRSQRSLFECFALLSWFAIEWFVCLTRNNTSLRFISFKAFTCFDIRLLNSWRCCSEFLNSERTVTLLILFILSSSSVQYSPVVLCSKSIGFLHNVKRYRPRSPIDHFSLPSVST